MSGPAPHRVWYLSGVGLTQLDSAEPLALGTAPSMLGEPPARSSPMSENHSTSGFAPHRCRHSDGLRTTQHTTLHLPFNPDSGTFRSLPLFDLTCSCSRLQQSFSSAALRLPVWHFTDVQG
ncbi:hypothetical protein B0H15DRAFT_805555 [Mycena belliarum]|uniref:Uncharacterized protein n=1 Tax=Mycena belliarum TaxID=1033014 RepID=A0AAD6TW81_9AGAR|nr:hypothetical protein B0H15DRAFT_805555 [Mycena belliae]